MSDKELLSLAMEAAKGAYAPYSGCRVGAALLCGNGKVYCGCNIENAAFSPTCCAERVAFFKAVSEGERDFVAIAVVGSSGEAWEESFPPCGVCRQVMAEFCDPKCFRVLLGNAEVCRAYTLAELLPLSFSL